MSREGPPAAGVGDGDRDAAHEKLANALRRAGSMEGEAAAVGAASPPSVGEPVSSATNTSSHSNSNATSTSTSRTAGFSLLSQQRTLGGGGVPSSLYTLGKGSDDEDEDSDSPGDSPGGRGSRYLDSYRLDGLERPAELSTHVLPGGGTSGHSFLEVDSRHYHSLMRVGRVVLVFALLDMLLSVFLALFGWWVNLLKIPLALLGYFAAKKFNPKLVYWYLLGNMVDLGIGLLVFLYTLVAGSSWGMVLGLLVDLGLQAALIYFTWKFHEELKKAMSSYSALYELP